LSQIKYKFYISRTISNIYRILLKYKNYISSLGNIFCIITGGISIYHGITVKYIELFGLNNNKHNILENIKFVFNNDFNNNNKIKKKN
jgi:hypothetical protein